jgi:hypothetical protein
VSFYLHADAYTDVNVGMGIGILIPEAMISKSTIDKLASVDDKVLLAVSDLVGCLLTETTTRRSIW